MLHILWMIIRFLLITIGVILGVVLGLIILTVLLLLFCPVCYQAAGEKTEKELIGKAKVSWLFHGIAVAVEYGKAKGLDYDIRVFGISLKKVKNWLSNIKKKKRKPKTEKAEVSRIKKEDASKTIPEQIPEKALDGAVTEDEAPVVQKADSESETKPESKAETEIIPTEKRTEETIEETIEESTEESLEENKAEKKTGINVIQKIVSLLQKVLLKIQAVFQKLLNIKNRIESSLKKIRSGVKNIRHKAAIGLNFIQDERTLAALSLIKKEIFSILRSVFPRRIYGNVTFGLEDDPSVMGGILAVLGATIPIHKNCVELHPVFDKTILEGEVAFKGKIYGYIFVIAALKIWFNKNFRFVFRCLTKKEEKNKNG